jgi:hypothetical protein
MKKDKHWMCCLGSAEGRIDIKLLARIASIGNAGDRRFRKLNSTRRHAVCKIQLLRVSFVPEPKAGNDEDEKQRTKDEFDHARYVPIKALVHNEKRRPQLVPPFL